MDYSPAIFDPDKGHTVTVTAQVVVPVDEPALVGTFTVALPFNLVIQDGKVVDDAVVLSEATFVADLEQVQVEIELPDQEITPEDVGEVADRVKGLLGN